MRLLRRNRKIALKFPQELQMGHFRNASSKVSSLFRNKNHLSTKLFERKMVQDQATSLLRPGPHCGWVSQVPDAVQRTGRNAYECITNSLCKTTSMVYGGAMRVKCLAQGHTTENSEEAGLEPPTN